MRLALLEGTGRLAACSRLFEEEAPVRRPNCCSPGAADAMVEPAVHSAVESPSASSKQLPVKRVGSIDAYRGLVMLLMVAEVMHFCRVARHFPDSRLWGFLCFHQSHVPWVGCSIHDMIQPSFSFLVGVALPFSLASRSRRGQTPRRMAVHAFVRAAILIFLGIFLRSMGQDRTNFTFEDTLTQIGLGYGFLFLLGLRPRRDQWIALVLILAGYWLAFALYPTPAPDFDYESVGVPNDWEHLAGGFAAHWNKNVNLASDFDRWFLNLFPRAEPFLYNGGGYLTLSFVPTLATMLIGLIAGGWLKDERSGLQKISRLAALGAACTAIGYALDWWGLCPMVKRIWTPSFALFSGGLCCWTLGLLYAVIDVAGLRKWAFPLIVVGMNSIAIYVMSWTMRRFVESSIHTHLGASYTQILGEELEPIVVGFTVVIVFWLILYWMYRRKIFLRI